MNPIDHQGTYALPAAQIDRFMIMLEIGYPPTPDDEVKVLDYHLGATSPLSALQPVISSAPADRVARHGPVHPRDSRAQAHGGRTTSPSCAARARKVRR